MDSYAGTGNFASKPEFFVVQEIHGVCSHLKNPRLAILNIYVAEFYESSVGQTEMLKMKDFHSFMHVATLTSFS